MPYLLFDFVAKNGTNEVHVWASKLQKKERAKLNVRLDLLELHGPGLRPDILAGTSQAGVQKLKVHGGVQLRPLLCGGPINVQGEFTLLAGAKEIGNKWSPAGILAVADGRKAEVIADATNRRVVHVRP